MTPSILTEDIEPDPVGADFYLDQFESAKKLAAASNGQFDYVVTIPSGIYGFSRSSYMNSATTFALYCAVQAQRKVPLYFPGSMERWYVGQDFVDSTHLAKFDIWCGVTGKCGGERFNASNGSVFCWETLWPWLCKEFGVEMPELDPTTLAPTKYGGFGLNGVESFDRDPAIDNLTNFPSLLPHSVSVQVEMTGMKLPDPASSTTLDVDLSQLAGSDAVGTPNHVDENAWKEICAKYPNMDPDAIKWATWWFLEFGRGTSNKMILLNFDKARRFGFHHYMDPKQSFKDTFTRMRRAGALPPAPASAN